MKIFPVSKLGNGFCLSKNCLFLLSDKSEQHFSGNFNFGPYLSDCPTKQPRIKTQLQTTEATQEMDGSDIKINVSQNKEKNNKILSWHLTLYKVNFFLQMLRHC